MQGEKIQTISLYNTLHANIFLGYNNDSICGKLQAIHFSSSDATGELRVLDLEPKICSYVSALSLPKLCALGQIPRLI